MKARVTVTLKSGVLDPQGKAIEGALRALGIEGVASVRQGKVFDVDFEGEDAEVAEATLRSACERLLANTVIENFQVDLDRSERKSAAGGAGEQDESSTDRAVDPTQAAAEDAEMPTEGHP